MADAIFETGSFQQSEIAVALGGFPAPSDRYAVFRGYLFGPVETLPEDSNAPEGVYLLYLDDTFTQWLTIKAEDLKGSVTMPVNAFDGRGKVWVAHDAVITHSFSGEANCVADSVGSAADPGGGPTRRPGPPY